MKFLHKLSFFSFGKKVVYIFLTCSYKKRKKKKEFELMIFVSIGMFTDICRADISVYVTFKKIIIKKKKKKSYIYTKLSKERNGTVQN
jgi:hypothetical protein